MTPLDLLLTPWTYLTAVALVAFAAAALMMHRWWALAIALVLMTWWCVTGG